MDFHSFCGGLTMRNPCPDDITSGCVGGVLQGELVTVRKLLRSHVFYSS